MKRIIIINKDQVSSVNFNEVTEDSANTLSYNLDGTKTFIGFTGDIPSFVTNETIYSLNEFYDFTSDYSNGWEVDPEEEEII
tara:strand:- start:208 stop:453 length:246 start_codon:yes stop_codon:yes gene_type:complete